MSRFERDHAGIGRMLRAEGEAAGILLDLQLRGTKVAHEAERTSNRETGAYASSWKIRVINPGGFAHDRAEVEVYNDDDAAIFNEVGNGHNTPPHTLLKALHAASGDI